MKYSRSGQYQLIRLNIITNTKNPVVLDMMGSFTDAAIYESIYDHTMSGNATFVDTNNLIQKYALGRGEKVEVEWITTGVDTDSIYMVGEVFDISETAKIGEHAAGFTLHFASPESIASIKKKMFSGFKTSIASIIADIFSRIRRQAPIKTKQLNATPTRNIEHVVFTGQTSLSAVQMMTERAVSSGGKSGFVFFENNREFRLVPIDDLYQGEPVIEYVYKSTSSYDDVINAHEESANTFQDFELEKVNKYADDILDGQYGSAWGYLSLTDKAMNIYNYNAKTAYNESSSLGKSPVSLDSGFNQDYSDRLTIVYSGTQEPNEQWCIENKMKMLKTNTFSVNIGVFGNSTIKVGDTCMARIPAFSSDEFGDESIDSLSGKFLIAEIKHLLTPKHYNQRIKLIKDSFEEVIS